jgi:hypothetical protein
MTKIKLMLEYVEDIVLNILCTLDIWFFFYIKLREDRI